MRNADGIGIHEAAKRVGVRVSALRYWEQRGLLRPARDARNHYRRYDEQELHRLQIIALLRQAGYAFARIRTVLDELDAGKRELAVEVIAQRRAEVFSMSRACIEATVAFWSYATTWGRTPGSSPTTSRRDVALCST
jgi:DNA-binding transcriptional MerR regulator